MEMNENISKYELVFIVDAQLTDEEKESVCKGVTEIISKAGGKVINRQVWLERQKFTFLIKKKTPTIKAITKIRIATPTIAQTLFKTLEIFTDPKPKLPKKSPVAMRTIGLNGL